MIDKEYEPNCRETDPDMFFPDRSTDPVPTAILNLCNPCPLRITCLQFALDTHQDTGIWGGTNAAQRRALMRGKRRKKCVCCGSTMILEYPESAVCASCGLSWVTTRPTRQNTHSLPMKLPR